MSVGPDVYNYATFSVAGTVTLSDGTPCILHSLSLTDTTTGTVTVRDGTLAAAATCMLILAGTQMTYGPLDMEIPNGLRIVTSGNTKGVVSYTLI